MQNKLLVLKIECHGLAQSNDVQWRCVFNLNLHSQCCMRCFIYSSVILVLKVFVSVHCCIHLLWLVSCRCWNCVLTVTWSQAFAKIMSLCLLNSWSTPKRFKISKYALHLVIERRLQFLEAKLCSPEFRGSTQMSALITEAPLLTPKIWPKIHDISETVRDGCRRLKFSAIFLRHVVPWPSVTFV